MGFLRQVLQELGRGDLVTSQPGRTGGYTLARAPEEIKLNYIIQALFDTHFLLFWLVSTLAVLSLYLTVRRFTYTRLAATAAVFGLGTFLHVYEGLTLMCIAAGALSIGITECLDRKSDGWAPRFCW